MDRKKIKSFDRLSLDDLKDDAEFIPLMSMEDEDAMEKENLPETLPILPLRNTVLFPGVVIPITAGRDKSIRLINESNKGDKIIGVVSQKDENEEEPEFGDINTTGTVAQILRVLKMPDGNTTVIIQGKKRFRVNEVITTSPYMTATVSEVSEARPPVDEEEFTAIIDSIKEMALRIIKESPNLPSEADRKSTRLNSSHVRISYAVFCLKKKKK